MTISKSEFGYNARKGKRDGSISCKSVLSRAKQRGQWGKFFIVDKPYNPN
jgi:hypothetical protein